MALAVQQSLFDAGGGAPMVEFTRWVEGVLLGDIALGMCVVAVALIGALMLTGTLPLREGSRVVVGCFVLLSAPVIGAALIGDGFIFRTGPGQRMAIAVEAGSQREALRSADHDPYAGASLRREEVLPRPW